MHSTGLISRWVQKQSLRRVCKMDLLQQCIPPSPCHHCEQSLAHKYVCYCTAFFYSVFRTASSAGSRALKPMRDTVRGDFTLFTGLAHLLSPLLLASSFSCKIIHIYNLGNSAPLYFSCFNIPILI